MKYNKITLPDLNNGQGCRITIWFSGCTLHCKNCFNSELWDFNNGINFSNTTKNIIFDLLNKPEYRGLSILGGEPTDQGEELVDFLKETKERFPNKDIWMWSGRTIEELIESGNSKYLSYIDYLIDGPFIEEQSELNLKFKGSKNQTIWEKVGNVWYVSSLND